MLKAATIRDAQTKVIAMIIITKVKPAAIRDVPMQHTAILMITNKVKYATTRDAQILVTIIHNRNPRPRPTLEFVTLSTSQTGHLT
jgi:hypothetical protein